MKLIKTVTDNYILVDATKEFHGEGYLLGTTTVSDAPRLSLKNCQAIERGYDLDEMAKKFRNETIMNSSFISDETSFKEGAKAIIEILGDKKFSEEDINKAMNWIMTQYFEFHEQPTTGRREHYIQSLQQTEWEVEIVMEEPLVAKARQIHGEYVASKLIESTIFPKPLLDADGCLILKRK